MIIILIRSMMIIAIIRITCICIHLVMLIVMLIVRCIVIFIVMHIVILIVIRIWIYIYIYMYMYISRHQSGLYFVPPRPGAWSNHAAPHANPHYFLFRVGWREAPPI